MNLHTARKTIVKLDGGLAKTGSIYAPKGIDKYENLNQMATVVAPYEDYLQKGDRVFVSHLAAANSKRIDKLTHAGPLDIYAIIRNNVIISTPTYTILEGMPDVENVGAIITITRGESIPMGKVIHSRDENIKQGEIVGHYKRVNIPMTINGKKYYAIKPEYIPFREDGSPLPNFIKIRNIDEEKEYIQKNGLYIMRKDTAKSGTGKIIQSTVPEFKDGQFIIYQKRGWMNVLVNGRNVQYLDNRVSSIILTIEPKEEWK